MSDRIVAWGYRSEDPYGAGELVLSVKKPVDRREIHPLVLASDLTAAKARIVELEGDRNDWRGACMRTAALLAAAEAVADRRLGLIRLARNMLRDMDAAHYAIDAELAQAAEANGGEMA